LPPRNAKKKPPYHHGDLEQALIDAGLAIVERGGVEALSLRAVARSANVSHAAPYHHFKSKAALLAAVAAAGFDRMLATIGDLAAERQAAEPLDRLRAVGRGYVTFAVTQPSVFRLMFRPELTQPSRHPRLQEAEARAFGTLLEAILALQQSGQVPGRDPRRPAAFAWSCVHGLATLHLDGVFAETPVCEVPFAELAESINECIIRGLQTFDWK
jgi:AcrR family transcriptional regulator